jgi:hypothetical protein
MPFPRSGLVVDLRVVWQSGPDPSAHAAVTVTLAVAGEPGAREAG